MITVNERADECAVQLSGTSVNPSMASACKVLTSDKRNSWHLAAVLSAILMQIGAFKSEPGGINEVHADEATRRLGLNKNPAVSHRMENGAD